MSKPESTDSSGTTDTHAEQPSANEVTAQTTSVVEQTTDAPPPSLFPAPVIAIVAFAVFTSYALIQCVRLRIAERVKRWAPIGHVLIWGISMLMSGAVAIRMGSPDWLFFGLALVVMLVVLNLSWLRSLLAGVALTLEHHLEIGDSVRVDDLEGDITHFGLRATQIRAVDGTLHDIPNERLLTHNVANLRSDGSDSACTIQIAVPTHISVTSAKQIALDAAMLSPLASPRHRPDVFLSEREHPEAPLHLQIRGYAFDPNYQEHFRSDVITRVMKDFDQKRQRSTPIDIS